MKTIKQNLYISQERRRKRREATQETLLYLNSNNFTEKLSKGLNVLSPYHRKQAFALSENVNKFVSEIGVKNVGFLTLTFADNVIDNKEASKRFKSVTTHLFVKIFGSRWMLVKERQKERGKKNDDAGAWHYHILVDCKRDIRTGLNFDEIYGTKKRRPKYSSASPYLRSLWAILREDLPKYGFGRPELLPIKTNVEAMTLYVGKYISKHVDGREEEDKGVRLISYSQGFGQSSTKIAWNSDGAKEWRKKLKKFADVVGCKSMDDLTFVYGSKWAWHLKYLIMCIEHLSPERRLAMKRNYEMIICRNDASRFTFRPTLKNGKLVIGGTGEILF